MNNYPVNSIRSSVAAAVACVVFAAVLSLAVASKATQASDAKTNATAAATVKDSSLNDKNFPEDEKQIRDLLDAQASDWNKGDIDHFVAGYRRSSDTLFVGAQGINRGFESVVERYKTQYPDKKSMGRLKFLNLEVHMTSANSAFAVGEFNLETANKETRSGFFTLNLVKTADKWEIVADHTTAR